MSSYHQDDQTQTLPWNRYLIISPRKSISILLSIVTLSFVIFGYPGNFRFESESFSHNMEPGSRLKQFPQKDQPEQFSIGFTRSELKEEKQLVFRTTSNFEYTYFLELTSTNSDQLTFFSSGLGARNDLLETVHLNDNCRKIDVLVKRQLDFSGNQIEVSCDDSIMGTFRSPSFIFTTVEAGINLDYTMQIPHFTGNIKTASFFHAATLLWWIGLAYRIYPSGSNKRLEASRVRRSSLLTPLASLSILGLATVTMPALVDDGSVLSIIKNFRASSGATNNIFSASALEWPVGSGAIALLNLVIGSNPSVLITRIPIFASFVVSVYFLYLTSMRVRPEPDQRNDAPVLLFASFTSILVGWGVTLRLEFLLLPISCMLLYLVVDGFNRALLLGHEQPSDNRMVKGDPDGFENCLIRRSFGILFLGGVAVSVTQAGLAIFLAGFVGAYQILRLAKHLNARTFSFLIISGAGGFLSTQPWISIDQFLKLSGNFRAANGSLHSTTILSEIDRYVSTASESTLRIFGVYLLLIGLVSCILLISSKRCRRSFFIGTVTFSAYIGLALTSSRWMWHLIVLAPFASLSLHAIWQRIRDEPSTPLVQSDLTPRPGAQVRINRFYSRIRSRSGILIFLLALTYLSLSSLPRSTRSLTGSTPNLRDPAALAEMQNRVDSILSPAFGPIPLIVVALFCVIFFLVNAFDKPSAFAHHLAVSIAFAPIFILSFYPLFSASLEEDIPSHVGLPLFELKQRSDCGWLSSYNAFLLPAPINQVEKAAVLTSQLENARFALNNLQWIATTDFYADIPKGHSIVVRNHRNLGGLVEIENFGTVNFPEQTFSELRILMTANEPQKAFIRLANVDFAILDTRRWVSVDPSALVKFTNGLPDPVFHTLTPCVSSNSNNGLFWSQFDWTLSNPSITDLGQSAPLDVGLRMANEYGVVRVSCPSFGDLIDENQCLYLYLET